MVTAYSNLCPHLVQTVALTALGAPQLGQVFLFVTIASGDGVVCGVGVPSKSAVGLATWNGSSAATETAGCVVLPGAVTDAVAESFAGGAAAAG